MNLYQKIDWLIGQWCERKALRPLKILLPAYNPPLIHTDEFHILLEALRDVKGLCRSELSPEELTHIISALNEVEAALKK